VRANAAVLVGLFCAAVPTLARGQQATATERYILQERCGKQASSFFEKNYKEAVNTKDGIQRLYNYESHYSVSGSTTTRVGLISLTGGRDQAARRARYWSAQAHGSSSSIFCIGQPLTSLARISAR
jgi:hypothetical protein